MKKITFLLLTFISILNSNAQTALNFESAKNGQKVNIPTITCPTEFTFEMWVNYSDQLDNYVTLLEFGNDAPYFGLEGQKPTLYGAINATTNLPVNQWTHLAITYSSIAQEAKIYINGHLNKTATGVILNTSGIGAGIGYNSGDATFNGSIDEVRIWNKVRTDVEVLADMNSCLTGNETALYAYYNFNEGSGVLVNDLTGNNFDGDMTNMDSATDWVGSPFCTTLTREENQFAENVKAFPNPCVDIVQIESETELKYSVYSVLGNPLKVGSFSVGINSLDLSEFESGVYLLELTNENQMKRVIRVVKK